MNVAFERASFASAQNVCMQTSRTFAPSLAGLHRLLCNANSTVQRNSKRKQISAGNVACTALVGHSKCKVQRPNARMPGNAICSERSSGPLGQGADSLSLDDWCFPDDVIRTLHVAQPPAVFGPLTSSARDAAGVVADPALQDAIASLGLLRVFMCRGRWSHARARWLRAAGQGRGQGQHLWCHWHTGGSEAR